MEPLLGTHRSGPRPVLLDRLLQSFPAWLGLLLCPLLLQRGLAAERVTSEFRLEVVAAYEADAGWTTNWVWTVGTNRFWIVPIPMWSLKVNRGERRLEVHNTNGTSVVTLRYTVLTNAPTSEDLRGIVAERHGGFQVIGEETLNSGYGSAVVFDLLLAEQGERVRPTMAAWKTGLIVNEGGLLECTLRTSVRSQPDLVSTFRRFLVGVRLPPPDEEEAVP